MRGSLIIFFYRYYLIYKLKDFAPEPVILLFLKFSYAELNNPICSETIVFYHYFLILNDL